MQILSLRIKCKNYKNLTKRIFFLYIVMYVKFSQHILKVAKSTAVADEALGNVRTVRAFAMEAKEHE